MLKRNISDVLMLAMGVAAAQCNGRTVGGSCQSNADCPAGSICQDSACWQVCSLDRECSQGSCCKIGLCAADGCALPEISGIDADGAPELDPSKVAHRIRSRLIIHGRNLEGATARLDDGSLSWPLEVCSTTGVRMELVLPQGLVSGTTYALVVTNQAGDCSAPLPVLQGERPVVDLGGGLIGDGTPGAPLAADFAGSGVASTVSRSDHDHPVQAVIPPGAIMPYAGAVAPQGWLLCDGSEVSRATFADLFAAIGIAYGPGDGATTFNLPNLSGRVPVGLDTTQPEFDLLGATGGANTHTLTVAEMPAHTHVQNAHSHGLNFTDVIRNSGSSAVGGGGQVGPGDNLNVQGQTATNQNTGGGVSHNNLQPYQVVSYIIKT